MDFMPRLGNAALISGTKLNIIMEKSMPVINNGK